MTPVRTAMTRWLHRNQIGILSTVYVLVALFFVFFKRLNLDEGIILDAARLVISEGAFPYRDFPFSQGPLAPFLYGIPVHIFGPSILVGRVVSFAASIATLSATIFLAKRFAGRGAAALAVALTVPCLPLLWTYTTVRPEALATPLVLTAAVLLCVRWRSVLGWASAPSVLVWAAGVRPTNALALLGVFSLVAYQLRGSPRRLAQVTGVVALHGLLVFGVPLLLASERMVYHTLVAQVMRGQRLGFPVPTTLGEALNLRLGYLLLPSAGYFPLPLLALAAAFYLVWRWNDEPRPRLALPVREGPSLQLALLALAVLVYLPQLGLGVGFPPYFATSAALFCPAIGSALWTWTRGTPPVRVAPIGSVVAALLAASVLNAFVYAGDWLVIRDTSLLQLRSLAQDLRRLAPAKCMILTFQTYVTTETGCRTLPGLEYSVFSYFPDMSTAEADRRGVLNRTLLNQRLVEFLPELIVIERNDLRVLGAAPRAVAFLNPRSESDRTRMEAMLHEALPEMKGRYAFVDGYPLAVGPKLYFDPGDRYLLVFARADIGRPVGEGT
jgi:hypothetical protein